MARWSAALRGSAFPLPSYSGFCKPVMAQDRCCIGARRRLLGFQTDVLEREAKRGCGITVDGAVLVAIFG